MHHGCFEIGLGAFYEVSNAHWVYELSVYTIHCIVGVHLSPVCGELSVDCRIWRAAWRGADYQRGY